MGDKVKPRGTEDLGSEETVDDFIAPQTTTCMFCFAPVDLESDYTYYEVTTFVRGPRRDSAVLRAYSGRYSCRYCIKGVSSRRKAERDALLRFNPQNHERVLGTQEAINQSLNRRNS
jgi:hypothetical protein